MQSTHGRAPGSRSDAVANRERLLSAAAASIKLSGEKVPMADIAAAAGVGVGTLYRHFPTREALLSGVTQRSLEGVLARARKAAGLKGPAVDAIAWFFEQTIKHREELILPLHGGPMVLDDPSMALRAEIRVVLGSVLARGRDDGSIRSDITPTDIIIAGAQLAQPLPNMSDWNQAARRQARVYLDGISAPTPSRLPRLPKGLYAQ